MYVYTIVLRIHQRVTPPFTADFDPREKLHVKRNVTSEKPRVEVGATTFHRERRRATDSESESLFRRRSRTLHDCQRAVNAPLLSPPSANFTPTTGQDVYPSNGPDRIPTYAIVNSVTHSSNPQTHTVARDTSGVSVLTFCATSGCLVAKMQQTS